MLDTNKLGQNVHTITAHALKAAVAKLENGEHFDALHFADWIKSAGGAITFAKTPAQTPMLVVLTDLNGLADSDDDSVRCIDPEASGMIHVGGDHFATAITSMTFKHAVTRAVAGLSEELAHDVIAESATLFAELVRAAIVVEHLDLTPVYLREVLLVKVGFAVQMIVNAHKTGNLPQNQFYRELARKLIIEPGSLRALWEADKLVIKINPLRMTAAVSDELVKRGINPRRLAEDHGFHHGDDLVCISTPFDPLVLAELAIQKLEGADVMLDGFEVEKLTRYLNATRPDSTLTEPALGWPQEAHMPYSVGLGGKAGAVALDDPLGR